VGASDEYTDAALERVGSDPAFIRLGDALSAGLDGRLGVLLAPNRPQKTMVCPT
jgi:hypothetical protein